MHQHTLFDFEEWKPVPEHDGIYEVSNHGRARSLPRILANYRGQKFRREGRILTPRKMKSGHIFYGFWHKNNQTCWLAHRLVLTVFVGPCPEGMEGCHNDGDPSNNHVSNLRWDTRRSNILDAIKHGAHVNTSKTHCPRGHELELPNLVPSSIKKGRRDCLACSRAHNHVRYNKHKKPIFQQIADSYHDAIMREKNAD